MTPLAFSSVSPCRTTNNCIRADSRQSKFRRYGFDDIVSRRTLHVAGSAAKMAAMESLTNTRILVVGDCMHDVYEYFSTDHRKELKSEFPGKWAYFNAQETDALGGAGNVAANIAGVGARTRLVGVVGADDSGAR